MHAPRGQCTLFFTAVGATTYYGIMWSRQQLCLASEGVCPVLLRYRGGSLVRELSSTPLCCCYSTAVSFLSFGHHMTSTTKSFPNTMPRRLTPGLSSDFSCIIFLVLRGIFLKNQCLWVAKPLSLVGSGISQKKTVAAIHYQRSCSGNCHNFPLFPLTRNVGDHCSRGLTL